MRPPCSLALLFACVAAAQNDPLTEAVAILRTSDELTARTSPCRRCAKTSPRRSRC